MCAVTFLYALLLRAVQDAGADKLMRYKEEHGFGFSCHLLQYEKKFEIYI